MKKTIITTTLGLLVLPVASPAATIAWGSATNVSGISDISTTGTLVFARNLGAANNYTINGVTFTGDTAATAVVSDVGTTDITTGITTRWGHATFNAFGQPTPVSGTDYGAMLNTGIYEDGDGSMHTHTLSNLTVGWEYQIQVWFNDVRAPSPAGTTRQIRLDSGTSTPTVFLTADTVAPTGAQFVIGTFTADSTNQTLRWQETGSSNAGGTINAIQLRVPEPSVTALFGLAGLGLVTRRRR